MIHFILERTLIVTARFRRYALFVYILFIKYLPKLSSMKYLFGPSETETLSAWVCLEYDPLHVLGNVNVIRPA